MAKPIYRTFLRTENELSMQVDETLVARIMDIETGDFVVPGHRTSCPGLLGPIQPGWQSHCDSQSRWTGSRFFDSETGEIILSGPDT